MGNSSPPYERIFLNFFHQLRKEGFLIGVEEYRLSLDAIYNRIKTDLHDTQAKEELIYSLEDIRNILRIIWAKSPYEIETFNKLFDDSIKNAILTQPWYDQLKGSVSPKKTTPSTLTDKQSDPQYNESSKSLFPAPLKNNRWMMLKAAVQELIDDWKKFLSNDDKNDILILSLLSLLCCTLVVGSAINHLWDMDNSSTETEQSGQRLSGQRLSGEPHINRSRTPENNWVTITGKLIICVSGLLLVSYCGSEAYSSIMRKYPKNTTFMDDELDMLPLVTKRNTKYFPLTQVQILQEFRKLYYPSRKGTSKIIDINATIQQVAYQRILTHFIFQPNYINMAKLFVLIDCSGSMNPCCEFSEHMLESIYACSEIQKRKALASNNLMSKQPAFYYFENYETEYLYLNQQLSENKKVTIKSALSSQLHNSILIISDAGAARGYLNSSRVEGTYLFINLIRNYAQNIAWLNPIPKSYWKGTSAELIAEKVPMIDANLKGFRIAVDILRGYTKIV